MKKFKVPLVWGLTLALLGGLAGVPGTGSGSAAPGHSVRVTLTWQSPSTPNLDLVVVDPLGGVVEAATPRTESGGQLDFDDKCEPVAGGGPEIVSWPSGLAPEGPYRVKVRYTDECDAEGPTSWTVTLLVDGQTSLFMGTIRPKEVVKVTDFTVGPAAAALTRVVDAFPAPGQADVPLEPLFVIAFPRAMDPSSAVGNIELSRFPRGETVALETAWDEGYTTLFLLPQAPLASDADYRLYLGASLQDTDGNRLTLGRLLRTAKDEPGRFFYEFHTVRDAQPPQVIATFPVNGGRDVPLRPAIQLAFSEPMDPRTVEGRVFLARGESGVATLLPVSLRWNARRDVVYIVPQARLDPDTAYRVFIGAKAQDLAGNTLRQGSVLERSALGGEVVYRLRFRTAQEADPDPPPP